MGVYYKTKGNNQGNMCTRLKCYKEVKDTEIPSRRQPSYKKECISDIRITSLQIFGLNYTIISCRNDSRLTSKIKLISNLNPFLIFLEQYKTQSVAYYMN